MLNTWVGIKFWRLGPPKTEFYRTICIGISKLHMQDFDIFVPFLQMCKWGLIRRFIAPLRAGWWHNQERRNMCSFMGPLVSPRLIYFVHSKRLMPCVKPNAPSAQLSCARRETSDDKEFKTIKDARF